MSVKTLSIIFAIILATTYTNAKFTGDLLHMIKEDLNDQSALQTLKEFAEENFQMKKQSDNLYEFLHYFMTVDLEELSVYGGMEKDEQLNKFNEDVNKEINDYLQ